MCVCVCVCTPPLPACLPYALASILAPELKALQSTPATRTPTLVLHSSRAPSLYVPVPAWCRCRHSESPPASFFPHGIPLHPHPKETHIHSRLCLSVSVSVSDAISGVQGGGRKAAPGRLDRVLVACLGGCCESCVCVSKCAREKACDLAFPLRLRRSDPLAPSPASMPPCVGNDQKCDTKSRRPTHPPPARPSSLPSPLSSRALQPGAKDVVRSLIHMGERTSAQP